MSTRIYLAGAQRSGQSFTLEDAQFTHLVKVLRFTDGQTLTVFNGQGLEFTATLAEVGKKSAQVELLQQTRDELPSFLSLHLGQVISKGDRMDFTVQKATELGVHEITPLISERCDVRLKGERLDKKIEHWQKIAIAACQQSGRVHVPIIHPVEHLEDWLQARSEEVRLLLHPHQQQPLSDYATPRSVALLVGPEGGFSDFEVQQAVAQNFSGLTLGPRILRTETAALVALSVLQFQFGDLQGCAPK